MNIEHAPYFTFEFHTWGSWRERIPLGSDNIEELLQQLENGENLFDVVPGLKREEFDESSMKYGMFERRNETIINDERFVSIEGYKQVGKLLIPEEYVVNRGVLELRAQDSATHFYDRKIYVETLDKNPNVDKFYRNGSHYLPLDYNQILVLNKDQL